MLDVMELNPRGAAPESASAAQRVLLAAIRRYQRRTRRQGHCVFTPTCSEYGRLAIEQFGATRGAVMTLRRLTRCHGGNAGVVDYP